MPIELPMRLSEIFGRTGLQETRITAWGGYPVNVLHNPSKQQFERLSAKCRAIRGLLSLDGKDLWVWPGNMAVHVNVMQELGMDRVDCVAYNDGIWSGSVNSRNSDVYVDAIQRVTPKPQRKWSQKDKDLLAQLLDDPLISGEHEKGG